MQRPTYAVVDLNALRHNISALRSRLKPGTKYLAVVKANAYGHGLLEVAGAALDAGAEYIGVAIPEEGVALREAGFTTPILVFGALLPSYAPMVVEYGLHATVFTEPILHALAEAAANAGRPAYLHIKVDSGMGRIGLREEGELISLLSTIQSNKLLQLDGLYTHFAVSEIENKSFTLQQIERFQQFAAIANDMGFSPLLHAANSGGALSLQDESGFDMVRGGIAMYGCLPGSGCGEWADLKPVLSLKSTIVHIKTVQPGDSVSYGRRFIADSVRIIATLPIGYGDGYHRCLTGKAEVLLRGRRAPVVGAICMDQLMIDVTGIPDCAIGDEAYFIGGEGENAIHADELAAWADTISYEILLSLNDRVPRIYVG